MSGKKEYRTGERIDIQLFGAPAVQYNGAEVEIPRRQARAILYILSAQSWPASRDSICALLWDNDSNAEARRNLTRLLTQLRGLLPVPSVIQANNDNLWVDHGQIRSGILPFEAFSRGMSLRQHLEVCGQVVDTYLGTFLDGFALPNAPHFEHWLEEQRRYFEEIYLHALYEMMEEYAATGRLENAINMAQRYLRIDEIAENIQRRLIELLAASGNRLGAQRQFERYTRLLKSELNGDPMPETVNAYFIAVTGKPARA